MSRYNVDNIVKECVNIAKKYDLVFDTPVSLNGRLRTTLGRVSNYGTKTNYYPTKIEFNKSYVEKADDAEVHETICHEMAHWIVTKLTKERHGHDTYWKKIAKEVGARPEACYDTEDFEDAAEVGIRVAKAKYTLYCGCCLKKIGTRSRKCKVITNSDQYHSTCCKAHILIKEEED